MAKGSYSGSSIGIVRAGYSRSYTRTFGKREASKFVCNRCRCTFQIGEQGRQTTFGAYKHLKCPIGGGA